MKANSDAAYGWHGAVLGLVDLEHASEEVGGGDHEAHVRVVRGVVRCRTREFLVPVERRDEC